MSLDNPEQRGAFLDRECDGNAKLRDRVEALLGAVDRPEVVLDAPLVAPVEATAAADFILGLGATSAIPSGVTISVSEAEEPATPARRPRRPRSSA